MGITIIGQEGEEITPKKDVIKPGFEMPENQVEPGLEIVIPDKPLSKTRPFPMPLINPLLKREIEEILGNN